MKRPRQMTKYLFCHSFTKKGCVFVWTLLSLTTNAAFLKVTLSHESRNHPVSNGRYTIQDDNLFKTLSLQTGILPTKMF